MCGIACIEFGRSHLSQDEVSGKRVLEVGACNVNGSLRPQVEALGPSEYLGVDIAHGPGVDELCDITSLVSRYGRESFDVVLCTEVLEHVRDWRGAVSNLKNVLKANGVLLVTAPSTPFWYHGYPFDFWRYEIEDMAVLFADLSIEANERNPSTPGVFVKARKPTSFAEASLEAHALHSVITLRRCTSLRHRDLLWFKMKTATVRFLVRVIPANVRATLRAWLPRKRVR